MGQEPHSTLNDDAVKLAREVADRSLTEEPVTGPRYTTLSETAILADAVIRLEEQVEVYERGLRSVAFASNPDGDTWVLCTPELLDAARRASESSPASRAEA